MHQPPEIIDVVDVRVVRMQLDKTVGRSGGGSSVPVLEMGIGHFDLSLLREASVRIPRLELFVELDGPLVIPVIELVARFRINLLGGPAACLVDLGGEHRTRAEQPAQRERGKYR